MAAKKKTKPMTGGTSGSSNTKIDRQTVSKQMSLNKETLKNAQAAADAGYSVSLTWKNGILSAQTMGETPKPKPKKKKP